MIGISIIDNKTTELFSISLKNLLFLHSKNERFIKEEHEDENENRGNNQNQLDDLIKHHDNIESNGLVNKYDEETFPEKNKKSTTKHIANNFV